MKKPVNTFDAFDTLICRRRVEPGHVLDALERRAAIPGLAAARRAAEMELWRRGHPYGLADVWRLAGKCLGLDEAASCRLEAAEIAIEFEEVIPAAETLRLVNDGDVVVSDTCLSPATVKALLKAAGLQRQVAVVASNDGKHRGWIWPRLLELFAINQHLGDNPRSDGETASAAGVRAVIFTGAARTPVEAFLADAGWSELANLVRETRLANPHDGQRPRERHLWNLACQLNFPLLALASLRLEGTYRDPEDRFLFVSRDCLIWLRVHAALFPRRGSEYFYASRYCLFHPSESFRGYVDSTVTPAAVIVDLFSTGASWGRFLTRSVLRPRFFLIGWIDNASYLASPSAVRELDVACLMKTSDLGMPLHKGVEMLNYAPHPYVEDVLLLPGATPCPVFAESLEYEPTLPQAAVDAVDACIARVKHYDNPVSGPQGSVDAVIRKLIEWICADPGMAHVYPDHRRADGDYERRCNAG